MCGILRRERPACGKHRDGGTEGEYENVDEIEPVDGGDIAGGIKPLKEGAEIAVPKDPEPAHRGADVGREKK